MPRFELAPRIHCCRIGGFIFLDLAADRYFELDPDLERAFVQWVEGATIDAPMAAQLQAVGVLKPAQEPAAARAWRPPQVAPPSRSLFEDAHDRAPERASIAAVATWVVAATLACRAGWLDRLLDRLSQRPPRFEAEAEPLARRFIAARPFIPLEPVCLRDSLALALLLRRRRADFTLVIGVKRPFAAHAWVQHQDVVLNDCVDRVSEFTPILAT